MAKHPAATYKEAGVDIDKAGALVERIKASAASTHRGGVMGQLGAFGAFFEIPAHYRQPILVSGTDGVGTKLLLAQSWDCYDGVGQDLVAMCVNDIICHGAEPLFFLDYYATGQLSLTQASTVIESIAQGCRLAGCALIGGETAELPGMYSNEEIDLAGFCVGVVEKDQIIDEQRVVPGDCLIGLGSSGAHANGYSLIRSILSARGVSAADQLSDGQSLSAALLAPTRIYSRVVQTIAADYTIHGIAHITGGGLVENVPRCLPQGTAACIDRQQWAKPALFEWLQQMGNIETAEMYRCFNMGIGMVLVVSADDAKAIVALCQQLGEQAMVIGEVAKSSGAPRVIFDGCESGA